MSQTNAFGSDSSNSDTRERTHTRGRNLSATQPTVSRHSHPLSVEEQDDLLLSPDRLRDASFMQSSQPGSPMNPNSSLVEALTSMARSIESTHRLMQAQLELQNNSSASSPSGYSSSSYSSNEFNPIKFKPPDSYNGHPDHYHDFSFQIENFMAATLDRFIDDRQRTAYAGSLFRKDALVWYRRLCETGDPVLHNWKSFMRAFSDRFRDPSYLLKQKHKLRELRQGNMSIPTYITKFEAQASRTNITGPILVDFFVEGLNFEIADILVTLYPDEQPSDLPEIFRLARKAEKIHLNRQVIYARNSVSDSELRVPKKEKSDHLPKEENFDEYSRDSDSLSEDSDTDYDSEMDDDFVPSSSSYSFSSYSSSFYSSSSSSASAEDLPRGPLTERERQYRKENNLCMYCGDPAHQLSSCPVKPPRKGQTPLTSVDSVPPSTRKSVDPVPQSIRKPVDPVPHTTFRHVDSVPQSICKPVDPVPRTIRKPMDSVPPSIRKSVDSVPLTTRKVMIASPYAPTPTRVTLKSSQTLGSASGFLLLTRVISRNSEIPISAIVDSASSENFVDLAFCQDHSIPVHPLQTPIPVVLGDGTTCYVNSYANFTLIIGKHIEETTALVSNLTLNPLILGLSWITIHAPTIDWANMTLTLASKHCLQACNLTQPEIIRACSSPRLDSENSDANSEISLVDFNCNPACNSENYLEIFSFPDIPMEFDHPTDTASFSQLVPTPIEPEETSEFISIFTFPESPIPIPDALSSDFSLLLPVQPVEDTVEDSAVPTAVVNSENSDLFSPFSSSFPEASGLMPAHLLKRRIATNKKLPANIPKIRDKPPIRALLPSIYGSEISRALERKWDSKFPPLRPPDPPLKTTISVNFISSQFRLFRLFRLIHRGSERFIAKPMKPPPWIYPTVVYLAGCQLPDYFPLANFPAVAQAGSPGPPFEGPVCQESGIPDRVARPTRPKTSPKSTDLVDSNSLEWDRCPSMDTVLVHSLVSTKTGHLVELVESFLVTCSDIPLRVNVSVTCLTNSGLLPYPSLTLLVIVPRPWTPLLFALLNAPMLLSRILCKEIQEDQMEPRDLLIEPSQIAVEVLLYSHEQEVLQVPHFLHSHISRNMSL